MEYVYGRKYVTINKLNSKMSTPKTEEKKPKEPYTQERKKADRTFLIYALICLAVLIVSYYVSNS